MNLSDQMNKWINKEWILRIYDHNSSICLSSIYLSTYLSNLCCRKCYLFIFKCSKTNLKFWKICTSKPQVYLHIVEKQNSYGQTIYGNIYFATIILYVISEFIMAFSSYPSEPSFLSFQRAYPPSSTTTCWSCPEYPHWLYSLVSLSSLPGKPCDSSNFNFQMMPNSINNTRFSPELQKIPCR